jgi:rubrerythrin
MASKETTQLIEQAIVEALGYENRVRDIYREAVHQTKDPVGKKVFGVLGDEEQGHVDYLEVKLECLRSTGEVAPGGLETNLPTSEAIKTGIEKLRSQLASTEDRASEAELLRKALTMEEETSAFYLKMVRELPVEGQAFFSPFLAIEDGHVAIVQAELDSVTGMGFWFDYQEFNLEAG